MNSNKGQMRAVAAKMLMGMPEVEANRAAEICQGLTVELGVRGKHNKINPVILAAMNLLTSIDLFIEIHKAALEDVDKVIGIPAPFPHVDLIQEMMQIMITPQAEVPEIEVPDSVAKH